MCRQGVCVWGKLKFFCNQAFNMKNMKGENIICANSKEMCPNKLLCNLLSCIKSLLSYQTCISRNLLTHSLSFSIFFPKSQNHFARYSRAFQTTTIKTVMMMMKVMKEDNNSDSNIKIMTLKNKFVVHYPTPHYNCT